MPSGRLPSPLPTELAAVAVAAQRRQTAQRALDDSVEALHVAICDAYAAGHAVRDLVGLTGLHRVSVHQIVRTGERPTSQADTR